MDMYHFVSKWTFKAPLPAVWDAIFDSDQWPEWWKYVEKVTTVEKGDAQEIGTVKIFEWSTKFFYTIHFHSRLIENEYGKRLKGEAWGELEGTGLWTFEEHDGLTTATYHWDVSTTKPWMNFMAPILKPLFKFNHDIVMKDGEVGLRKRLGLD